MLQVCVNSMILHNHNSFIVLVCKVILLIDLFTLTANEIAMSDSVTVSIGLLTKGVFSLRLRVKGDVKS